MCGQSEKFTQDRRTQIDFQHCSLIFDQQIEPNSAHCYKSNEGIFSFVKLEKNCEKCVARVKSSPIIGVHELTFIIVT